MTTRKQKNDGVKAMVAAMVEVLAAINTIAEKHKVCPSCLAYKVADMMSDGQISDAQHIADAHAETVQ